LSKRDIDRLQKLIRHIRGVQENALILGERLMEQGHFNLGKMIIANSFLHDNTKFLGSEWEYLSTEPSDHDLKIAVSQHNRTNRHHPEFYDGGIHDMPREYLAELICDWKSRSGERGTSLIEWINTEAMKRYRFSKDDLVYRDLMEFVDLLIEPPLKNVAEL